MHSANYYSCKSRTRKFYMKSFTDMLCKFFLNNFSYIKIDFCLTQLRKMLPKCEMSYFRNSEAQRSNGKTSNLKKSTTALDHDILSSPEYPSTSSDLKMIPQPPPPPKLYWVQHQQATSAAQNINSRGGASGGRYGSPATSGLISGSGGAGPTSTAVASQRQLQTIVTTPLSHHPGASVGAAQPPTRDQLYNRRSRGNIHYINDDSDVWFLKKKV